MTGLFVRVRQRLRAGICLPICRTLKIPIGALERAERAAAGNGIHLRISAHETAETRGGRREAFRSWRVDVRPRPRPSDNERPRSDLLPSAIVSQHKCLFLSVLVNPRKERVALATSFAVISANADNQPSQQLGARARSNAELLRLPRS